MDTQQVDYTKLAKRGDNEVLKALLSSGIDVDTTNNDGETLLMLAVENENPETVELLLENGADPNREDPDGRTALEIARQMGSESLIESLESHT